MADEDKDSKTEEPTEKKISDTVEKGNLPSSRELPILASFAVILTFTMFMIQGDVLRIASFLTLFLERPEDWPIGTGSDVVDLYQKVLVEIGKTIFGVLALLMGAGIVASALQNFPQMVLDRIQPKASRISPAAGWKRIFSAAGLVEFAKSLAKLCVVVAVITVMARSEGANILLGMITPPTAFGETIRQMVVTVLTCIVVVMMVIAGFDIVWSRFNWRKDLRMSKQEVKDEMKQAEGDPIVKSRIRSLARDRARRRMISAVPRATLVIANPTHYAIALRYVRAEDSAPVVLAKGQDLVALRIREIAEANNIPVFEEPVLARSMYKQVSVDSVIPQQFFQAVAELIRVVYAKQPRKQV
jgi:flagellar biosynthetic protein FlhB